MSLLVNTITKEFVNKLTTRRIVIPEQLSQSRYLPLFGTRSFSFVIDTACDEAEESSSQRPNLFLWRYENKLE
jgi:hypothetical protein